MNNIELQALRRLLFFSVPEAAQWVAASDDRPEGVSERAWRLWEAGERPVPEDVAERLRTLAMWRQQMLAQAGSEIARAHAAHGAPADIVLVWYDDLAAWKTKGEPDFIWRPHCSALAHLAGMYDNVRLVSFDLKTYRKWLASRADSPALRSAWAAQV